MTGHDDRRPAHGSGMRAEHDDRLTHADAGWPRHTEEPGEDPPEGAADAVEEEASVRRAVDDDTSTAAFTGQDAEDRGPLAPEFQEPADSDE
ncbi:hypothetical protein ACIBAI_17200 [Streptomyces sp. NPDC051041]|uniref:hypothetical protein n=1 Tax=Streptomyces sp. NPDC051041 TaxID=3365640 RepID=UPI00378F0B4B